MSEQEQQSGLTIDFYLPRIGGEGFQELEAWLTERIDAKAPALARFLWDVMEAETRRRLIFSADGTVPREVEFPLLQCLDWTNADAADALDALYSLAYTVRNVELGEFLDKVLMAVVIDVKRRLLKGT